MVEWLHFPPFNNELYIQCQLASTSEGRIWTFMIYLHYLTCMSH